jgi:hypothetical protein
MLGGAEADFPENAARSSLINRQKATFMVANVFQGEAS